MSSGIYSITHESGKRYIGSAVNLRGRLANHKSRLRLGTHDNPHLQSARNLYGEDAFVFEVLEECEPEFLVSTEQWWINMLRPEYNIRPTASSNFGIFVSEDTRRKLSVAGAGHPVSAETRRKIGESMLGNQRFLGHKHTDETRLLQSKASKGRPKSPEHCRNISKSQMGRPWSEARRAADKRHSK